MKIHVRYFAIFRERLAREGEDLELAEGTRVEGALATLGDRHEIIARLRGRFRAAVNMAMVDDDFALSDGDELALIPPVAGGARYAVIRDQPLSIDRVASEVMRAECGGLVLFAGLVRRESGGRAVEKLEYEAYSEMAEAVFARLCDEIEAEYPGVVLAIEHRVGTLRIGELAVVLAAAAPHRAEAFEAARALIDRLKDHAPIWKKETGPDGTEWVGLGP